MSDASYGYVHFGNDNLAQYIDEWKDYHIPYDDIDTTNLMDATANIFPQFLFEEEEDGAIPLSSSTFGARIYKNKNLLRLRAWSDLNIDSLRSTPDTKRLPDATILRSLHFDEFDVADVSLGDFLSNGYNTEVTKGYPDISGASMSQDDNWINTSSDFPTHHTFSNIKLRSNSTTQANPQNSSVIQTPRVARTRQASQDKFQTPITRIVR